MTERSLSLTRPRREGFALRLSLGLAVLILAALLLAPAALAAPPPIRAGPTINAEGYADYPPFVANDHSVNACASPPPALDATSATRRPAGHDACTSRSASAPSRPPRAP